MDSSSDDDYTSTEEENLVDKFLFHHIDDILDIFDDLKERFKYDPTFLASLKSPQFIDFVTDQLFYPNRSLAEDANWQDSFDDFVDEFNHEVNLSYYLVDMFFEKFQHKLSFPKWIELCYQFTDM